MGYVSCLGDVSKEFYFYLDICHSLGRTLSGLFRNPLVSVTWVYLHQKIQDFFSLSGIFASDFPQFWPCFLAAVQQFISNFLDAIFKESPDIRITLVADQQKPIPVYVLLECNQGDLWAFNQYWAILHIGKVGKTFQALAIGWFSLW